MKYIRAIFKNYIGFYNGMGLYEIDIDFTRCHHNIVLIKGSNGRGKSTILNHLNPFPDSSNSFIPDKTAEKKLILFHEGDTYSIQLISPADLKGRKTTKAYIQKNGIELNENGNISSYKDIIFSEFELDSNYISLSRLSCTDRGLGDKTPAERKKFTSNIIDNLEIYNNMYKTLNKKSLIYKSHINTIHTKIQNIGNKVDLEQRLSMLRSKESDLNSHIMTLNNQIVAIQSKNSIDEEEARAIQTITNTSEELKLKLDSLSVQLDTLYHKTKIARQDISAKYSNDKNLLDKYSSKLEELNTIWLDKSNRLNDVSNNILTLEAELANTDTNDTISDRYKASSDTINEYKEELIKLNIPVDTSLIFTISNLIAFCDKFIILLDHFNDGMIPADIEYIISKYSKENIDNMIKVQQTYVDEIEKAKLSIADIQGQMKVLGTLESRPKECRIDKCPFISEALKLKKNLKTDLVDDLNNLQEIILSLSKNITKIQEEIDYCSSLSSKKMELDIIRSIILENVEPLSIFFPKFIETFDANLSNMYSFVEIREHSNLTDGLNLLKLLEDEINTNKLLEVEYKGFREKIQLLNSNRVMIEKLKKEQESLIETTRNIKLQMDEYRKTISDISSNINTEAHYSELYDSFKLVESEYNSVQSKLEEYRIKSSKALEALSSINGKRVEITNLSTELNPIIQDINRISGQLTMLDSYYEEYNMYKSSYDTVEVIKKYCNPTGGGIQTLFMQIYMSKTKQVANEVLAMLFNGSYQLLDFVINESEFRIPFVGEGLPVDDISYGSGAQISMMSMIINLVLLHQASTKFNIAQLDELTSQLDAYNNTIFMDVLLHCISILSLEQVFLISHSLDVDDGIADIIDLGGLEQFNNESINKNVIWSYNDIIKQ